MSTCKLSNTSIRSQKISETLNRTCGKFFEPSEQHSQILGVRLSIMNIKTIVFHVFQNVSNILDSGKACKSKSKQFHQHNVEHSKQLRIYLETSKNNSDKSVASTEMGFNNIKWTPKKFHKVHNFAKRLRNTFRVLWTISEEIRTQQNKLMNI